MKGKKGVAGVAASLALLAAAPPYAAALTLETTADPFVFTVVGGGSFAVLGRAATPAGQRLIIEQGYRYHEIEPPEGEIFTNSPVSTRREQALNELFQGNHFALADARGRLYKATNARFVSYQSAPEGRIVELTFLGDFAGDLELAVELEPGSTARLPFGPADKNYYRRATVTSSSGLDVQVDTRSRYGAQDRWQAGVTFYLTGPRGRGRYGTADDGEEEYALFYLGARDGREGWVAYEVDGEEGNLFTIGGFDAF